jgi:large conductance mechanosensitive channel
MIREFKEFITRGNVIDLAVAVVVGAAFTAIVTSFVNNIFNGLLGIIGGKPSFDDSLILTVNNAQIRFGAFLSSIVNFLIIAVVMFLVVKLINRMQEARADKKEDEEETEVELLTQIRDALVNGSPTQTPSGGVPKDLDA